MSGKTRSTRSIWTFRSIMLVILLVVVLPVTAVTSAGIVAITIGKSTVAMVTGILVICLAAMVFTGAFILMLLVRKNARVMRQQETFLSNITHELRTPLTSIRMYAQTLKLGRVTDQEKAEQCLDTILKEAARLERLIDQMLIWRRIAEGREIYQRKPTKISDAVKDAAGSFRAMVDHQNIDLIIEKIGDEVIVEIDRAAVADALLNLMFNSYKYSGHQKKIQIECEQTKKGVELSVEDNGIGIEKKDQKKIFDRFFRLEQKTETGTQGVGLGLSIVKHVVESHGGKVNVESEPGRGSRFTMIFPPPRKKRSDSGTSNEEEKRKSDGGRG